MTPGELAARRAIAAERRQERAQAREWDRMRRLWVPTVFERDTEPMERPANGITIRVAR